MNENVDSGTNTPAFTVTLTLDLVALTRVLHLSLSAAHFLNSSHDDVSGASERMSPSLRLSYTCLTARSSVGVYAFSWSLRI